MDHAPYRHGPRRTASPETDHGPCRAFRRQGVQPRQCRRRSGRNRAVTARLLRNRDPLCGQLQQPPELPHRTDGKKWGGTPYQAPPSRSKLRHCPRISEDSFHCMQVDAGSRSGDKHGYREFVLRFGGKQSSTRRWFLFRWEWLNKLLNKIYE